MPDAPGLRIIKRENGERHAYWIANRAAVHAGYVPRTVRLHYDLDRADQVALLEAHCRELQATMLAWLGTPEKRVVFNGTLASLIVLYQTAPDSPFHLLRPNTRTCYAEWCKELGRFGARRLDRVLGPDLRRWYAVVRSPDGYDGPPRDRLAYGCVRQMFRILVNYGVELGLDSCLKLDRIISKVRLRADLVARTDEHTGRVAMTFAQAEAIVNEGLSRGTARHRSVALGVACQFEFGLAQIDVIGWFEKGAHIAPVGDANKMVRGRVWRGGLRHEQLQDAVTKMARSKTGVPGVFEVSEAPLVQRALAAVPEAERHGPLVVDEHGVPLRRRHYARLFRDMAEAAGVPDAVKSMHARHGAASEADAAGVPEEDIARLLQHTSPSVTRAHYLTGSVQRSRRTARARVAHRQKDKGVA
jgi:hypothetical protein